ncbi:MAG: hypothetical protein HN846_00050 [Candidatus Pacebacteria bacterium]|jgi:hypothetical protein|nr:hypothetical protein [Candidatus Paceibacterota bacterium]MBT3512169.1 hypothetical protein [Candidatus Paceibacterota bacterium]MBT4004896.1 hypothetical protein [Candidatus Paceibacterota bacterium]MBT4358662.1 hypothetical protein [Candidatus Paceibacterota bacterium]MBT4681343.1 hypothetical protein [Candidatus Paceibacterota bacterium]
MTINNDEPKIHSSFDLSLVTTLSIFFPIKSIDRSNPRKANFLFDQTPELSKFIEKYWNKQIKVEPQQFFNQLKSIKTRIYAEN